jgi:hypothetical protein
MEETVGLIRVAENGPAHGVPYLPIWSGLAVDTLVNGAILWTAWAALAASRSRWRARRGACVRCGYDLRGGSHVTCPECGAA